MSVTLQAKGIDKLYQALARLPDLIQGGVKVTGEPVNYWAVWEWGSSRLLEPGPKTLWSTNPDGEAAILTKTAPFGYIRVNQQRYLEILRERIKAASLPTTPVSKWEGKLQKELYEASVQCAGVISDAAPIDSGDLRSHIEPCDPDDPLLETGTFNQYGNTALELRF